MCNFPVRMRKKRGNVESGALKEGLGRIRAIN